MMVKTDSHILGRNAKDVDLPTRQTLNQSYIYILFTAVSLVLSVIPRTQ